jgi:phenylacetic acid degradation operon negative regulatory protein
MRAAALGRRAAVLGVDAAAMRVALGRLVRERIVRSPARGSYAIGASGEAMNALARGWREGEARVRPWQGRWLVVAVDHLGRTDRRQVRLRERALRLGGFGRAESGAWVRADNLAAPFSDVATRLHAIGLDDGALLLGDAAALPADDTTFRTLWDRDAIEAGYRHWIAELAASEARLPRLDRDAAARETLLLGQAVIRAINLDPLLPDDLVDTALRAHMTEAMRHYDDLGRACWARID